MTSICSGGLADATILFCFASGEIEGKNYLWKCVRKKFIRDCAFRRMQIKSCFTLFKNDFSHSIRTSQNSYFSENVARQKCCRAFMHSQRHEVRAESSEVD